jgi:hypothetical protein
MNKFNWIKFFGSVFGRAAFDNGGVPYNSGFSMSNKESPSRIDHRKLIRSKVPSEN